MNRKPATPEAVSDPGNQAVDEHEVRSIVRLLGEVAAKPVDLMAKRWLLLDGLCDFTGADEWRWSTRHLESSVCLGFRRRMRSDSVAKPLRFVGTNETDSDVALMQPAEPGPFVVVSSRIVEDSIESRIELRRDPDDPAIPEVRRFLAALVLDEISWIHQRRDPPVAPAEISPRCRQICDLLLLGLARKDVANQLAISQGTVSGYIREIYRYYDVNSHAEFLCKFRANPRLIS